MSEICPKCGHEYDSMLDMWSHKNNSRICLTRQLTAAKANEPLFNRMSDCLDDIRKVLEDKSYASRLNQLDAIRDLIDFELPETPNDLIKNQLTAAHARIAELEAQVEQMKAAKKQREEAGIRRVTDGIFPQELP